MNLGDFKNRVIIESRVSGTDSVGGQSLQWQRTEPFLVWARIESLTGRELQAAQAVNADVTHEITIRYLPYLTAACRIIYTDPEGTLHYYYLAEPPMDYDFGHDYMVFTAIEGLATT